MKIRLSFIKVVLTLCFSYVSVYATALEYQEIYESEHKNFYKKMQQKIKAASKAASKTASKEVKALYKEIDYVPVWVDKVYLTQYAELLLHELKVDFDDGVHEALLASYKVLFPNDATSKIPESIEDKVHLELGMMALYIKHMSEVLKGSKSKHTPLSLLKLTLKEKSIVVALNKITDARISHRIAKVDINTTLLKESERMDEVHIKKLQKGSAKHRLDALYALLDYHPIWLGEKGFSSYAKSLFRHIEQDITLDKKSNLYEEHKSLKDTPLPQEKPQKVAFEFKVAKLYQDYMSHLLYGQIDWKKFQGVLKHKRNADWVTHKVLLSPELLLLESLGEGSLDFAFKKAKPDFPLYDKMLVSLKQYKDIAENGGWDKLADFKDLKPGMQSDIVPALRERLQKEGDYISCEENNETELYDDCLLLGVQKFQSRHGLASEGYVGKMTRKALSESVDSKIARIKLNLNRMKWIKRSSDRYHIWVNVPEFRLYVFDKQKMIDTMRVIVGRKGHNTPIFYNKVRTIVLNPYWRIPASIIRQETVPKLKRDPHYTNKKHIEIHTGYSEHSKRVNPLSVNWHKYGHRLPPYKFMQSPGTFNALGKVKYLFPNKYSVYMHDTNERQLFTKDMRALSHGCIRLHKPFELLETFSKIDTSIDFEKSQKILEGNKKTPLKLKHTVPVDTVYLTTWVDSNGTVAFRNDLYGYDTLQLESKKQY